MGYGLRQLLLLSASIVATSMAVNAIAADAKATGKDKDKDTVQVAAATTPASAATPAAVTTPAAQSGAGNTEKVTVTATRRKTVIQKVPVAVTAISGKAAEDAKVENIEDLTAIVPSLQITNGGNPAAYTARIRGIGTQGNNAGLEAAVGTFIDGVYRSRASVAFGDLGEISAIEVLRGPQGTLFGRNTSAGILNIVTKEPDLNVNGQMGEVTFGNYDQIVVKGGANAVVTPGVFAIRLFGAYNEREGYVDVNPGRPDAYDGNAQQYVTFRAQALWKISEAIEAKLIADFSHRNDECCAAVTLFPGGNGRAPTVPFPNTSGPAIINYLEAPLPGKFAVNSLDRLESFGNRSTRTDTNDEGLSAELRWDLGFGDLVSITALRDWKNSYGQDSDWSGADIIYFPSDGSNLTRFENFTHEMRLNGANNWVDWLVGVFYSDEDITRRSNLTNGEEMERYLSLHRIGDIDTPGVAPFNSMRAALNAFVGHPLATPIFTPNVPGGLGGDDLYKQNAESFAVFTHNIFHITEDLDFTAGLRYTTETKEFEATYRSPGGTGCASAEALYGLDPVAGAPAGQRPVIGLVCLPGARHALDVLTALAPHRQTRTESEFSGIATLAWEIEDNLNTYATYSRGYKAGGFNLDRSFSDAAGSIVSGPVGLQVVRAPDTSFPAEFVDAFELGLKTSFGDGAFSLNTALFYQEFENFQLNTFTGVSFIVTSVPEVISQGVEIETFWRTPIKGLTTSFAVQYTDAHYGDIGSLTTPGSFIARNPGLFLLVGNSLTHSPEWTVTGAFDYDFPLFDAWSGLFHMDARWQDDMVTGSNMDPRKTQEAFALVGLKLGAYSEGGKYGIEFFARNLFDERYINTAFDSPLQGSAPSPTAAGTSTIDAFVGEPRMIGITLRATN